MSYTSFNVAVAESAKNRSNPRELIRALAGRTVRSGRSRSANSCCVLHGGGRLSQPAASCKVFLNLRPPLRQRVGRPFPFRHQRLDPATRPDVPEHRRDLSEPAAATIGG